MCAEIRTAFSCAGVRRLLAVIVATLSVSVAASAQTAAGGVYHSLVLKSDGTLWAFGYNGEGASKASKTPMATSS